GHANGFDQSSPGQIVNWVLFSLLTITTGLVWERRRGLLSRLVGAGVRGVEIIGGKMLTMVALTVLQQVFLILLGQLAFGVDYFNNVGAVALVVISLSVLAAAMGLLVTSLFRTEQAVIATTILAAQLLAALGGAWFPLEVTSSTFSRVAHYLPTAWVIDSFHGIILKGWGVAEVASALTVTWAWAVFFFILAVWRFRVQ
ncbi:MAG: ABC transporter permease, partial [Thermoleophilia bacterium]|nr:ABC transporter permease [Thermoleophilia bacterium]